VGSLNFYDKKRKGKETKKVVGEKGWVLQDETKLIGWAEVTILNTHRERLGMGRRISRSLWGVKGTQGGTPRKFEGMHRS